MSEDFGAPIGGINRSTKPYIIRALHQWALDNGYTPQIVVNAQMPHVDVPEAFVQNGRIILNIHPDSVRKLEMENDFISLYARFSGQPHGIFVPTEAVMAIFARENGQGIAFPEEEAPPTPPSPPDTPPPDNSRKSQSDWQEVKNAPSKRGGHLKVVK